MYKKVLLILSSANKLRRKSFSDKSSAPPLGLIYIGNMLKIHGYPVEIIDLSVEDYSLDDFKQFLEQYSPDVVGISVYTETYFSSIEISKIIKSCVPSCKIVLGGAHVTFLPEESLLNDSVDFVVRNEGEFAFVQLMEYLNNSHSYIIENIKGLSYKNAKGEIISNEQRGYLKNLDVLPIPDENILPSENYTYAATILSSRGCPGGCIYCASRAMSGGKYRTRSIENFIGEIYFKYKKYGIKYFNIFDDTFTANVKRLSLFCENIKEIGEDITWRCDSRADVLNEDILHMLKDAGCIAIHIGIESGSQEVLDGLKKYIDLKHAEAMVKYANSIGIRPMCSFIIGHHSDTYETIDMTVELGIKFKNEYNAMVAFSTNTPYPGTYLYNNAEKLGITIHTKNWNKYDIVQPVISTKNISCTELRNIMYEGQIRMNN
ncbi:radical SAM protein [Tissierella sp. MB52-C2]|uniref:B12-binding domain-containing radical SAM protein n=1 Tax=Tissierella sp. MB52-C2 TaxID=3070999 RepID=UPI00280C28DF|nr:radical SAM protein [Tissierella sp. MB52-C2]WMM25970.1 radical SAM protein [Tissierella sp. MB52-C2]